MKTKILQAEQLFEAADLIRGGELVAFPTETVYGLGASIFKEEAVKKIFQVKKRPCENPLIAHIAKPQDCEKIAHELPPVFYQLAKTFFPGPLTLIVKKKPTVPDCVSAGLDSIAIRMPSHPIALELVRLVDSPIVAPSANRSGKPSSTTAAHVLQDFDGKISAVIDGGPCQYGMESTVIDLVHFERPTLLRLGALDKIEIEEKTGLRIDVYQRGPKSSPGMRFRHYAPDLPVTIFSNASEFETCIQQAKNIFPISSGQHPFSVASLQPETLYGHLRFAEKNGYDEIAIYSDENVSETVKNRLEKIAHACHSN